MTNARPFIAFLGLLALTGGLCFGAWGWLNMPVQATTSDTERPQATQTLKAENTPLPPTNTPTASPMPYTPTPNNAATVAAINLQTAQEYVRAEEIKAAAIVEQERIRQNGEARAIEVQVTLEAQRAEYARAEAARIEAENKAAAIELARLDLLHKAEMERQNYGLRVVMVAGVVLLLVGFFAVLIRSWWLAAPVEYDEPEADDWQDVPYTIGHLTTPAMQEIFGTPDQMRDFCTGVLRGQRPSHNVWVRWLKAYSEPQFNALQDGLVKYGLARWKNDAEHRAGIAWTDAGQRFLRAATSSPPPPPTPSAPILPSARQIDSDFDAVGQGGDIEKDTNE